MMWRASVRLVPSSAFPGRRRAHSHLSTAGGPLAPGAIAQLGGWRERPFSSSGSAGDSHSFAKIAPDELVRLNRTSVALFRLLLRESRSAAASSPFSEGLLLQPPVDHRDQGAARWLDSDAYSAWPPSPPPSVGGGGGGEGGGRICDDAEKDETRRRTGRIADFFLRWAPDPPGGSSIGRSSGSGSGGDDGRAEEEDLARRGLILIARNVGIDHIDFLPNVLPKRLETGGDGTDATRRYILASRRDLALAVRTAFLRVSGLSETEEEQIQKTLTGGDVVSLHRRAIDAVGLLHGQAELSRCTSVSVDEGRGVRVVATSRWIGSTPADGHWFAYRIRVENFLTAAASAVSCEEEEGEKPGEFEEVGRGAIQLLGRHWVIRELPPNDDGTDCGSNGTVCGSDSDSDCSSSDLDDSDSDRDSYDDDDPNVQIVSAPRTGVVGHHPVIHPSTLFEYMSQSKITTDVGVMSGQFYMAEVKDGTQNRMVGDPVEAFRYPGGDDRLFSVEVGPFPLTSPGAEGGGIGTEGRERGR